MQMNDAADLRKRWERAGSPPCDHPGTEREYYLGGHTGDRVCVTCGETFTPDEYEALKVQKSQGQS